jgi:hypothetical protein
MEQTYNGNLVNIESLPFFRLSLKMDHPRCLIKSYDKLDDEEIEIIFDICENGFGVLKDINFDVVYDTNFNEKILPSMPSIIDRKGNEPYREGIVYLKIDKFALVIFMDFIDILDDNCYVLFVVQYV